ncbi:MAG: nicotinamide mononucleotide transporter [Ruminococcus sp.]|nr:nicotinamide mononucleotide transporter [Ruminococcus sp.]
MKLKNNPFKLLNRFELILWIISLIVVSLSFIFTKDSGILPLCASLIGVTSLIFLAKGHNLGQILIIIFAVLYGIISIKNKYYGEMITYLGMTAPMAVVALISWIRHPYKESDEVKVSSVSKKQIIVMNIFSILVTTAFYFILRALENDSLIVSTISITTSFLASYLSALRSPYSAFMYAANDVVLIVLWIIASVKDTGNTPMIICFIMFLINDLYGFYNWRKMEKRQNSHQ